MKLKETIWLCSLSIALLPTTSAWAATKTENRWSGRASFTYILNNGNTNMQTVGGELKGIHEGRSWRTTGLISGLNQSDSSVRKSEKYFGSLKLDKKLNEKSYAFVLLEHEDDRFSGFHYQTSLSLGYGRTIIDNKVHKLNLEIGPGFRRSELQATDHIREEAFIRGAMGYHWQMSDSSLFDQELSFQVGDEVSVTKSSTRLKTKINSHFSLSLAYDIKHNSEVPAGSKNTDTTATVSLDYNF